MNRSDLDLEIRRQVGRYVGGELSFVQLQEWLKPRLWHPYVTGDKPAARLIAAVDVRLGEYASGYWSEQLLKEALGALIEEEVQEHG